MRPHTEIVSVADLIWHTAELPAASGRARQQNLSYDEENGAASTRVRFDADWRRPAGYHVADTEWYVLDGTVLLGGHKLGPGDYLRAPAGLRVEEIEVAAGTEVMLFREFGDSEFVPSDEDRAEWIPRGGTTASTERGELTVVHAADAPWGGNIYEGEEQRILQLQILYHDPGSPQEPSKGWLTNLVRVPPGKVGTIVEHHQVAEEAFGLSGRMDYNYGTFFAGSYFYRPPYVKHAYLHDGGGIGYTLLMRVDGNLTNWLTEDVGLAVGGRAVNYDPTDPHQAPAIAGLPVRSRSAGRWTGAGR